MFCRILKLFGMNIAYIFQPFPQNVGNAKFEQRDGHGKWRNSHGGGGGGELQRKSVGP